MVLFRFALETEQEGPGQSSSSIKTPFSLVSSTAGLLAAVTLSIFAIRFLMRHENWVIAKVTRPQLRPDHYEEQNG